LFALLFVPELVLPPIRYGILTPALLKCRLVEQQEAYNRFGEVKRATEPNKLIDLPLAQLEAYYNELHSLRDWLFGTTWALEACNARMELLRREIELRRLTEQSDRQHRESFDLGKRTFGLSEKTLFWAKVGGIAAAIGTSVLLVSDTGLSKFLRAMSFRLAPVSPKQNLPSAAATEAPTATLSPSESTPASPTSSATTTPIKFPPPAP
jgi:hypothetical protein